MRKYAAEEIPAMPGSTYQLALYNADGEVPATDEIIWQSDSDTDAVAHAQTVMASWPEWIGSLNRWHQPSGRLRGYVWIADIHDAGRQANTAVDGFDLAVNGTANAAREEMAIP